MSSPQLLFTGDRVVVDGKKIQQVSQLEVSPTVAEMRAPAPYQQQASLGYTVVAIINLYFTLMHGRIERPA